MKFLILGLPKTGKTMLVHTLNRIDNFRVLGEVFITRGTKNSNMPDHPHKVIQDIRVRDKKNNIHTWFHKFYGKSYNNDITDKLTSDDIDAFLETVYLPDKNCAFKLHHHHIESTPYLLKWFHNNPDIKVLHCNRKNKIKQALAAIGNRYRGSMFNADPSGTLNLMNDNAKRLENLREWFSNGPNPYLEIYYEDMTNDVDTDILNLKIIKDFLQVDMPDFMDIQTRKNTRNLISENLSNYDEFIKFFRGYEID